MLETLLGYRQNLVGRRVAIQNRIRAVVLARVWQGRGAANKKKYSDSVRSAQQSWRVLWRSHSDEPSPIAGGRASERKPFRRQV